ncbi:MAG: hypothetical protein MUF81_20880, partial [Verrucomicrobia bacterium]|nr:hypothetical protein [Verrucomicrobiota bacterium]
TGEFPAYARGRLQTKVRQTLDRPAEQEPDRSLAAGWRWLLGVATATAVVVLVVLPIFRTPNAPVIQLAMLDTTGGTRGSDTNEVQLLRQSWNAATMDSFSEFQLLRAWETNWPTGKQPAIKIIYDRAAAEMRVLERRQEKTIEKTFLIEQDLATALKQARIYIQSETKR